MDQEKNNSIFKVILIVSTIFLLFGGIFVFAYRLPVDVTEVREVEEFYTETEYVNEPYSTKECTDEKLPFKTEGHKIDKTCDQTDSVCNAHEQYCCENNWYGGCNKYCERCIEYSNPCKKYSYTCSASLRNLDTTNGGTFSYSNTFKDSNMNEVKTETKSAYVDKSDSRSLSFKYYTTIDEHIVCSGKVVSIPTKNICRDVIKDRKVPKEVVKTKKVDQEFQVVKYYTLFEIWTGKVKRYYHA